MKKIISAVDYTSESITNHQVCQNTTKIDSKFFLHEFQVMKKIRIKVGWLTWTRWGRHIGSDNILLTFGRGRIIAPSESLWKRHDLNKTSFTPEFYVEAALICVLPAWVVLCHLNQHIKDETSQLTLIHHRLTGGHQGPLQLWDRL